MAFLAGTIINNVRDLFPDPIYSGSTPQPDADGPLFRASTLYRWLDDGARLMVTRTGWTLTDWWSAPAFASQVMYGVNPMWIVADQMYHNAYRLSLESQSEANSFYPNASGGPQANRGYVFRQVDQMQIGLDPFPNVDTVSTTLNGGIGASDGSLVVASSAGFLPNGWLQIDGEIIGYTLISGTTIAQLRRGEGGTIAAAHSNGATVYSNNIWLKGMRVPRTITSSTSPVEVPLAWVSLLNAYLLGMMRQSEQEFQVSAQLLKQFEDGCASIERQIGRRDPITRRLGPDRQDGGVPPPAVSEPAQIQSSG